MAIYMKIDGLDGSVTSKGHENWIELETFSTGLARHVSTEVGRVVNREGSVPHFSEVQISKRADKSSQLLFEKACKGAALPQVLIDICATDSDLKPYSQYKFSKVILSHYNDSAFGQDHGSIEYIMLNFTQIEKTFTPRDIDNKPLSPVTAGYNLQRAEKL